MIAFNGAICVRVDVCEPNFKPDKPACSVLRRHSPVHKSSRQPLASSINLYTCCSLSYIFCSLGYILSSTSAATIV